MSVLNFIEILFEDKNILALNKPAGISVHKDGYDSEEYTIADWIMDKYPELEAVGEPMIAQNGSLIEKPGIVHRLDKDTTGVLLIAKNQPTFEYLKEQFKKHLIKKTYRLLVAGHFSPDKMEGMIDFPIGRSRRDPRIRVASTKAVGVLRPAVTYYRVLEQYGAAAYVEAHPKTGRTHQLRAHFKAIGHPLICDALYAPGGVCVPELNRQALHAFRIELKQSNGQILELTAPLPADFQAALEKFKHM